MTDPNRLVVAAIAALLMPLHAVCVELNERDILSSIGTTVLRTDPDTGDGVVVSGEDGGVVVGAGPLLTGARRAALEEGGTIVLANNASDNVIRIDPSSGDRVIVSGCTGSQVFPGCALVGGGPGGFVAPTDVAVEADGSILVMDEGSATLYRVDPVSGDRSIVSSNTVGSGVVGFGIAGLIALESDGSVLVYSRQFHALFRVDPVTGDRTIFSQDSTLLVTPIGTGPDFAEVFQVTVAADGGVLFVNEGAPTNAFVLRVDPLTGDRTVVSGCDELIGTCQSVVGAGDLLVSPRGIAVEADGNLIVSDRAAGPAPPGVLFRIDPATGDRTIIASFFVGTGPVGQGPVTIVGPAANQPPVADAGPNQAIHAGQTVFLDGTNSSDDNTATGDLQFQWTLISTPPDSGAAVDPPDSPTPAFVADRPGTYVIELVVVDQAGLPSDPDSVEVSSLNVSPTANAGSDQIVVVGTLATLDGSGSADVDGDPLSYSWSLVSVPAGSAAALVGDSLAVASLTPDVAGEYAVDLVVNDGFVDSNIDQAVVTAVAGTEFVVTLLMDTSEFINGLPDASFTRPGHRDRFNRRIARIVQTIENAVEQEANGRPDRAARTLARAVRRLDRLILRTDGCSLRGTPDPAEEDAAFRPDWIVDCGSQMVVYDSLLEARDLISP